jgi:hypothetical protein
MKQTQSEEQLAVAFEEVITNGAWASYYSPFTRMLREVACLQGRPDFVGLHAGATNISMDQTDQLAAVLKVPSTTRILSLLHYAAPRTEKYLLRASGFSLPVVRRSIMALESFDLITPSGHLTYVLSSSFPKIQWELWAFEIKVDHWQRALYQALQYRAFAHRVTVVLPERWVHRAEHNINRFSLLNVGVIALDVDKKAIRFINRPKKRSPASRFHNLFALGKFLHE